MADPVVKKVIIKKSDLPALSGEDNSYVIRYRIVSEDKNRTSHWSPYYSLALPARNVPNKQVQCSVIVTSNVINMVWQHPESETFQQYDIYIKTNLQASWTYLSSPSSTQFSTLVPTGISSFQVAVQVPTYPKKYFIDSAIFTSGIINVVVV